MARQRWQARPPMAAATTAAALVTRTIKIAAPATMAAQATMVAESIEAARSSEEVGCAEAAHTYRIIVAAVPVWPIVAVDAAGKQAPIRGFANGGNEGAASDVFVSPTPDASRGWAGPRGVRLVLATANVAVAAPR
jgi:hypothetical protein